MDAIATMKLLQPMPCDKCGQVLPVGSLVGGVRVTVTPRFETTANCKSWRIDETLAESGVKVTCQRCARLAVEKRQAHPLFGKDRQLIECSATAGLALLAATPPASPQPPA